MVLPVANTAVFLYLETGSSLNQLVYVLEHEFESNVSNTDTHTNTCIVHHINMYSSVLSICTSTMPQYTLYSASRRQPC